jgi:hypothetical protein
MNSLARQNTRVLAFYLYDLDGRPDGRDVDYWLRAEQQLSENLFGDQQEKRGESAPKFVRTRRGKSPIRNAFRLA